ncbi:MAG TPA: 50S ribosomal protein L25 [Candidatus Limnocylindria bacterium]|nr:50S ribosomal protein L25 [Candidatus Limnocylindria bacterium]
MELELSLNARDASGKKNKRLRRQGLVPGVVFGKGNDSVPVQVDGKAFETLYRAAGRTALVKINVPGSSGTKSAMIKGVQRHPLNGQALHVDFFLVDLKHEIQSEVPLTFVGEPPAVEMTGGTLMTPLDHLKIRALPADIPHEIQVDLTPLTDLEAAVHVRDIVLPDGKVTILNEPDELLARVLPPRVEEEEVVPAEEAAMEQAEAAQSVPETEGAAGETPTEGE